MPDWRCAIERRLAGLHLAPARETEIVDELSQHLDDRYNELRIGGATEEDAYRDVLEELGACGPREGESSSPAARASGGGAPRAVSNDADLVRELTGIEPARAEPLALGAAASTGGFIGGLWQDLRFGARLLVKNRGASLVVIITLALAIAANAIVFGFADLLLLRPLPIDNADRVVTIYGVDRRLGHNREWLSISDYLELRRQATSLADVSAMTTRQASLVGAGEPRAVMVNFVTTNVLSTWGLAAFSGRTFLPDEGTPGRANVAILSHRFWTADFAADPAAVGRTLTVNGERCTVVGVLSPNIEIGDLGEIDLWLPLDTTQAWESRSERVAEVFALRRPETTLEQVNAELTTISDRLRRADPVNHVDWQLRAMTIREATVGATTWIILALLGVVTLLVLVVACANIATVMLARASARRKEIALRLALGATRGRLVRQLLSEGMLLGLASGACGLGFAYAGLTAFKLLSPDSFFQRLAVNGNLLAFALTLSVVTPVLFAVMPALQSSRPDLNEDLKDGLRDAGASSRGNRSRSILLVAQVAFALAVLIVSGLVVRTVVAIEHVPLGLSACGLLTTRVRFDPPTYTSGPERLRMVESILDALAATSGVTAAAATNRLPLIEGEPVRRFTIAGQPAPQTTDLPWVSEVETLGDYTRATGVGLLEGRMWLPEDRGSAWPVAVVNREAARRYWPGRSPLGAHITMVEADGRPASDPIEIVGVIDNMRSGAVRQPPPPRIYRPLAPESAASVVFLARSPVEAAAAGPAIRDVLRNADRALAVSEVRPFDAQIATFLRTYDLIMGMFVGFASIGLIVAVAGVYGVTAFSVNQRGHEIGVRMALGATAANVVSLFISRSLRLILIGVAVGVAAGWAMGRTMNSILVETSPSDPATYTTVIGLIVMSGLVASLVPASRAVSIDPIAVLKRE
jgi:putative ABC transport system permease protein